MRAADRNRSATSSGVIANPTMSVDHLDEIADILVAGLLRLRAKQSNCSPAGDVSLDFSVVQSVHATENVEPAEAQ